MERDAAGGVCGVETDVERTGGETGGEADVVVAGVVDTEKSDKSIQTETNTFKSMNALNVPILYTLIWSKNEY